MTVKILGTCSVCGGRVAIPNVWHGIYPPTPSCIDCKAIAASSGPVIPMKRVETDEARDDALHIMERLRRTTR